MDALNFIEDNLKSLDRGIVATPTREYLEGFASANHGANDFLLMQMALNLGYKLAMEQVKEVISRKL